jgi:hypothetical protein
MYTFSERKNGKSASQIEQQWKQIPQFSEARKRQLSKANQRYHYKSLNQRFSFLPIFVQTNKYI